MTSHSITSERPADPQIAADSPSTDDLIERARALRPLLLESQRDTEDRTWPSEKIQQALLENGFYNVFTPKRYGGYEKGLKTFCTLARELARGCPSTAWCWALGHSHAFTAAAYFPKEAQDEMFRDGYFVAATFAYPRGTAERVQGGYRITGVFPYGSGSPYSNYYMGETKLASDTQHGSKGGPLFFAVARDQFELLNDWKGMLGLRGSGSQSVKLENAFVPDHRVLAESFTQLGLNGETAGYRLHRNPLYRVPELVLAPIHITAVVVGIAYAALSEYEHLMLTKAPELTPVLSNQLGGTPKVKADTAEARKNFGLATAEIEAADAVLLSAMDDVERLARHGDFTMLDNLRVPLQCAVSGRLAFNAVADPIWRTSGSSAGKDTARMQRYWRDISMYWNAPGNGFREPLAIAYSSAKWGPAATG